MNKKGQVLAVFLVALIAVAVLGAGFIAYKQGLLGAKQTVVGGTAEEIIATSTALNTGNIAKLGIWVEDSAKTNSQTKMAVPIYCKAQDGSTALIVDGTSSSTSAETTASTTIGKTVTCWAFNTSFQSDPITVSIDSEYTPITIKGYTVPATGSLGFYSDTLVTGSAGLVNITSSGTNSAGHFSKMKYTQSLSQKAIPLGGFYFDTVPNSNVTSLTIGSPAKVSGNPVTSVGIVSSSLPVTKVTTRKELMNYVFEMDTGASPINGIKPALVLEQNDYIETGILEITSGVGCIDVSSDLVSSYAFMKGWYRTTVGSADVRYGFENDASSATKIGYDITGDSFFCVDSD